MKSSSFIISELDSLATHFTAIKMRYGYDHLADCHVVEITPSDIFHNNEELAQVWMPISFQFSELFPFESIAFVSSDSTLKIDHSVKEWNSQSDFLGLEYYRGTIFEVQNMAMKIGFSEFFTTGISDPINFRHAHYETFLGEMIIQSSAIGVYSDLTSILEKTECDDPFKQLMLSKAA